MAKKPVQGVQQFGAKYGIGVPCRPNHNDVGCAAHGYARCDFCDWVSPNLQREPQLKTQCGTCGKASQGYAQCQKCTDSGAPMPLFLFEES